MNRVTIEIDDEIKRLEIGERLTSGSTYEVVVPGGAESVGEGELIFILPREYERWLPREMREVTPVVAARASLTTEDGVTHGVLSTNTDVLAKISERLFGETMTLPAVLHSAANAENVALGNATVMLTRVVSGEPTGAAVLYRGEKGDPGRNGETPYVGANGNWWIGTVDTGIGAKGEKGDKGDAAILKYVQDPVTKLYHEILAKTNILGQKVLCVSGVGVRRPENNWVERSELNDFAAKTDLEGLAAKTDLEGLAAKTDLEGLAAKTDLKGLAAKTDLEGLAKTKDVEDSLKDVVKKTDESVAFTGSLSAGSVSGSAFSSAMMPESVLENPAVPTSGSFIAFANGSVFAPCNGWMTVSASLKDGAVDLNVFLPDTDISICRSRHSGVLPLGSTGSFGTVSLCLPVPKGYRARLNYSSSTTISNIVFSKCFADRTEGDE